MRKKTVIAGFIIIILVLIASGGIFSLASEKGEPAAEVGGEVYLHTGSPLILSGGEVKMLDPANPDLGATVIQSRTLLPLRAISEYFGGEVTYDAVKKEAVIKYDGKQFYFPVGSKSYIAESGKERKEFAMDSQSLLIDGRTMVPLRVICENVLGKKVSYFDRVIAVADSEIALQSKPALMAEVKGKIGEAVKARTMKELEQALSGSGGRGYRVITEFENGLMPVAEDMRNGVSFSMDNSAAGLNGAGESGAPAAGDSYGAYAKMPSQAESDYSTTNVQVEGIDEADVVKTDGKYLYLAGNNVVRIVGADKGKLSDDTAIRLATDKNVQEIYVDGDKLVILGTRMEYEAGVGVPEPAMDTGVAVDRMTIMPPYYHSKTYSFADIYDISDPLRPILLKGHEMEGYYQSSRKNGDIVYLVTNNYPSGGVILPMMRDTAAGGKMFSMKLDDIMIMPRHPSPGYVIVSAINVTNSDKTEVEAITAYGATMYMNDSSLYLAFQNDYANTSIIRFDLEGMKVGYAGSGTVPGALLNQFSMDEYEGNLRVATTDWNTSSNGLYILDRSLNIAGSIDSLAKGESIYSVRFMGDKGYVVTFRTIDPLFVFDLSDPENPVLTGELKVPGFSSYLHPVGEDLLLGIGADTYEIFRKDESGKESVVGTRQGGLKFSLFDVSDMGKPKEISKYVVGDGGSSSEALYNHKAVMIDPAKGNVALDAHIAVEKDGSYRQGAVIVNYENRSLSLKGILDSRSSGVYGNDIPFARRVLYIGSELYYVQDGRITSYDYNSLKEIDTLVLR